MRELTKKGEQKEERWRGSEGKKNGKQRSLFSHLNGELIFYIVYSVKKKQKKPMFCKDGLYILLNLHSNQKLCVPCVPIMVCNTIWKEVKKKQVELERRNIIIVYLLIQGKRSNGELTELSWYMVSVCNRWWFDVGLSRYNLYWKRLVPKGKTKRQSQIEDEFIGCFVQWSKSFQGDRRA